MSQSGNGRIPLRATGEVGGNAKPCMNTLPASHSRRLLRWTLGATLAISVASIAACGSAKSRSGFDDGQLDSGTGEGGFGFTEGAASCQGLECKRVQCDNGEKTTLTGKVYDPAGANVLYNVMVYIPAGPNGDAPLPEIKEGVQCETCAGLALSPLVSALTDVKGEFILQDVPVADNVPVVVQVGKWRRKFTVNIKDKCATNPVPDKTFKLPRNGSEGDMPQIAVTAGGCDALQCLLKGIGIDDSEFVAGPGGKGHVHVFNGAGGTWPGAPSADQLWGAGASMLPYDISLLSCECDEHNENKGNRMGVHDYVNAGGRVFATHYHYTWLKNSPDPNWTGLAKWSPSGSATESDVNVSFPKGKALASWLMTVGASATEGKVSLTSITGELSSVAPPSQSWILNGASAVRYFSFNAPVEKEPEEQCGRAVYGDLHLMGSGIAACTGAGTLTPQQKALEFMFFDLAACIQADDTPPSPPK